MDRIRIGIVGLGRNTRERHVPGFAACKNTEIVAVCNRRADSTQQAATEFGIPRTYDHWQDLVEDADVDAVLIGTWPYLHGPITIAAIEAGKHVLTEARMAASLAEARAMYAAALEHPELVTQIVPSPLGLRAGRHVKRMIDSGYLGDLREYVVLGTNADFADAKAPLHWRQSAELSGRNSLTLGILHETLMRWLPDPIHVFATTNIYTPQRPDPDTGCLVHVSRPDSVHVLTGLADGARGIYHLSAGLHHGPSPEIQLYGSEGTIHYRFGANEHVAAGQFGQPMAAIEVPSEDVQTWRVEADFIDAIRGGTRPELTDFATGVRYMEFTEAVELSAMSGEAVHLPLRADADKD